MTPPLTSQSAFAPVASLPRGGHLGFQEGGSAPLELEADFVVVGSGAGGSAAAVILARAGQSVVLVEAGPWRDPGDYPSSALGAMRDLFADWGSVFTRGRAWWPIVQASCVGGTTVINSAIVVRTPGDCFRRWEQEQGVDGGWLESVVRRHQDRIEQELGVEPVPLQAQGGSTARALRASLALGLPAEVMQRAVRACEGSSQCLQGCRRGRKQSTNVTWIPELCRRGGTVLSCAPVERVELGGGRASGVLGRFREPVTRRKGQPFRVRARRAVLLAASATQSPLLLARSGYRHPRLGKGFQAHPGCGVLGLYPDDVDANQGATQGWSVTALRESEGLKLENLALPPELLAGRLAGGGTELVERMRLGRRLALWVVAVRAEAQGQVRASWGGGPRVDYSLGEADMRRLRKGLALVARLHFEAGAVAVWPGIQGLPASLSRDELGRLEQASLDPRAYTAILSHLFGGCSMHQDPAQGVVDGKGKVHGVDGLYVVDASAVPTTLGVNPQHTIMGLASAWAEQLVR